MRILVTGIAGFAGSHLAEYLLTHESTAQESLELHGVVHRHERRIQHLRNRLTLHKGDLRNALWVSELVQTVQPRYVAHLAAWSDVGGSWEQPWTTYELNIQCQLNLLEALHRWTPHCRTLVVTSNEVYGLIRPEDLPIDEETPFQPNSPYGVSKVTQDMMALQYWNGRRLPTLRARSFNHLGPNQSDDFVASAFARQIAEIEAGLRTPVVSVGNLESERDFTDVRDIARAYWLLLQQGKSGEAYNVGSGESRRIRWVLDTLVDMAECPVEIELDPARLRPSDVPMSVCDNAKLVQTTGWKPIYKLNDTLHQLLDYWRKEVHRTTQNPETT